MRLAASLLIGLALSARAFDFDDDEEEAPGGAPASFFGADDAGASSVPLHHALDGGAWVAHGTLQWRISKPAGKVAARVTQAKLGAADIDAFTAAARVGGFYTVSVPSVLSNPDSPRLTATVSACALLASKFEEHLQLTMGAVGTDRVVALSLVLPVVPTTCPTDGLPRIALDEVLVDTSASLLFPEQGPRPVGKIHDAAFLPPAAAAAAQRATALGPDGKPVSGGTAEGAEGAPQANQSFLRKYWMYILPVMVVMSMGNADAPADGDGGGKGGEGAGRPAARAARR